MFDFCRKKPQFFGFYPLLISLILWWGNGLQAHCIDDAWDLIEAINEANSENDDTTIDLCGNVIVLEESYDNSGIGLPSIGVSGSDYTLTIKNGTIQRDENASEQFGLIAVNYSGRLRLEDVTLANGFFEYGGAIVNEGLIESIDGCTFVHNLAFIGGAIFNVGGILYIKDSYFYENMSFIGGAIANVAYVERVIDTSIVENESCFGGGIFNVGYMESIIETSITQNDVNGQWCYGGINNTVGSYSGVPFNDSPGAQVIHQFVQSTVCVANTPSPWCDPGQGGGVYNIYFIGEIDRSVIAENQAENEGGGIFNGYYFLNDMSFATQGRIVVSDINNSTIANITNTTIADNNATFGGGILNVGDIENFAANTVSGNDAEEDGGGIYNSGFYTEIGSITTIINSTFSGNTADGNGAGIYNGTAITTLTNSTIADNHADLNGGGIYNAEGANINLISSIVAGNTASGENTGDDIFDNDCIANNSDPLHADCLFNVVYDVVDGGNNLIGSNDANFFVAGTPNALWSYVGTFAQIIDPRLGVLDNYGGPTETMPLFSNSPAIGAGANPNSLLFDQRGPGFPRETFGLADIGAFQTPQVGPKGPQGEPGEDGEDGSDGSDGFGGGFGGGGGGFPLPPPSLPVAPANIPVVETKAVPPSVKTNAELAPQPLAPVEKPRSPSISSGCSMVLGQGQQGNVLLWVVLALLFMRAQRRGVKRLS